MCSSMRAKLFVGNLNYETSIDNLEAVFRPFQGFLHTKVRSVLAAVPASLWTAVRALAQSVDNSTCSRHLGVLCATGLVTYTLLCC